MNRYDVQVEVRTVSRVVVEADNPDEAMELVGGISERDLAALSLFESTAHDRYVCAVESLDFDRWQWVVGPHREEGDDEAPAG